MSKNTLAKTAHLTWYSFEELNIHQLYGLLRARQEVFMMEQDVHYLDCDNKDQVCEHLIAYDSDDKLLGYSRLLPPGLAYEECSFGRILTTKEARGAGIGRLILKELLREQEKRYGDIGVRISAQLYLMETYTRYGFISVGEQYLEDTLPHIEMYIPPKENKSKKGK